MGQFTVTLALYPPAGGPPRVVTALVDTGAAYTIAPRPLLEALGARPLRSQRVVLADGRVEEWTLCQVEVECEGRRMATPVLMGPPGSPILLGATTLQELALGVDPLRHRLVPVEVYPV